MWTPPTTWEPRPIPDWLREGGPGLPDEWKAALRAMTIEAPGHDESHPVFFEMVTERAILRRGVPRQVLLDLLWARLADCLESTPDGEDIRGPVVGCRGPYWVPTPLGCKLAGIRLEEFKDDSPQWVWGAEWVGGEGPADDEPQGVLVRPEPGARALTKRILRWAEMSAAERIEAVGKAAKAAEDRLDREREAGFPGRRRLASKGKLKKARRRRRPAA